MKWKNVRLITHREVRDQLRDRRTLFMVAVLPVLLYPSLGIGMVQMMLMFQEQPRTVVVLGAKDLPEPSLIIDNRFDPGMVAGGKPVSDKLIVLTDQDTDEDSGKEETPADLKRKLRISHAQEIRKLVEKLDQKEKISEEEQEKITQEITTLFNESDIQVLIMIPDGLAENIKRVDNLILNSASGDRTGDDFEKAMLYTRPIVLRNSANEKSLMTFSRVKQIIDTWELRILQNRLKSVNLPDSFSAPVKYEIKDLAKKEQISANVWSKLFPAILVIMTLTGAFYPAVDVAAGEKERGTMETLLISPASRGELVVGKFLTVMLFSVSTAVLNLSSMAFTGNYISSTAGSGAMSRIGSLAPPSMPSICWLFILMIPLASLFSALCLALASFARSSKEGQYYLTPLLMVVMGMTVFCMSPAVEMQPFYSVMPVVGPALLLKKLLADPLNPEGLVYLMPVIVSSIGYSILALWWAVDQFKREDILFRESERFSPKLWLKHLLRDKEPVPTFSEAVFCFLIIMLLQFGAMNYMGAALKGDGSEDPTRLFKVLITQQLVVIACPALFMGLLLTSKVRDTFRLYWPQIRFLLAAILLPLVLHPLTIELSISLSWFFPQLPEGIADTMKSMSDPKTSILIILLAFAVAPAICEELVFRGFVLSGFSRHGREWIAIFLSSIMFGVMHMIPQQVFNATLLGVVLGLLAIKSGSLLPGITFHFIYNSLAVLHGRSAEFVGQQIHEYSLSSVIFIQDGIIRYGISTLVISAIIAAGLILMLIKSGQEDEDMTHD